MLYKIFWYTSPISLSEGSSDVEDVELSEDDFDNEKYELEEDHVEAIALSRVQKRFSERDIKTVVLSFPGWE